MLAALLGAAAAPIAASAAESLEQAFREADYIIDWRVRFESVDQDGIGSDAGAGTSRVRLGLQTAPLRNTSLLAEGVIVQDFDDDYDSTTNGRTQYPVVPDPAGFAAVNRFAIVNKSLQNATLTFGRQRIVLDDQRFIGNVGWRQNEQTFDGIRAQLGGAGKLKIDLTYANQVNRVFGPDSPQGKWEGDILLAHAARTLPVGTLTFFNYYLDVDAAAANSSNTVGARFAGQRPLGSHKVSYLLSYAHQKDAASNPATFAAAYFALEGGLTFGELGAALGLELLGNGGASAFSTPLATLHAFEGWADKFLATPTGGIADTYVKVGWPFGKHGRFSSVDFLSFYHDYSSDAGSVSYGEELDAQLVAKTAHISLTLKYANYAAETLFTDTSKLWLSLDYAF